MGNPALVWADARFGCPCRPARRRSRPAFDCRPKGRFLGLRVDGKRVSFSETVFYAFRDGKIGQVLSIIDKAVIEATE